MATSWFVRIGDREQGPLSAARLAEMASNGVFAPHDYVRRSDMEQWVPAGKVKGLVFRSSTADAGQAADTIFVSETLQTSSGRDVELLSNGTWRYKCVEFPPSSLSRIEVPKNSPESEFTFRKTRWGTTEREVRDSESGDPIHEQDGILLYSSRIAGLSSEVVYIFSENILVRSKYIITERHSYDFDYISDYMSIKELLSEKYGLPSGRNERFGDQIWKNDLYQDEPDDWGTAVGAGHLVYLSEWRTGGTSISLVLRGDNFDITLVIEYVSLQHAQIENELRQRRNLDDL